MFNDNLMMQACELAEKMNEGIALTEEEQMLYDDILEDADALGAFSLYTAFADVARLYMDADRQDIELLSREKVDISCYLTGSRWINEKNELKQAKKTAVFEKNF